MAGRAEGGPENRKVSRSLEKVREARERQKYADRLTMSIVLECNSILAALMLRRIGPLTISLGELLEGRELAIQGRVKKVTVPVAELPRWARFKAWILRRDPETYFRFEISPEPIAAAPPMPAPAAEDAATPN